MTEKYFWLDKEIQEMLPEIIATRRDLHKFAEPGWMEMRTTSCVVNELKDLGIDAILGKDVCAADSRMGLPSKEELDRHAEWAMKNGADPDILQLVKDGFTGAIFTLALGPGPVIALRFDMDALGVFETQDVVPKSVTDGVMHACGHDGHTAMGIAAAKLLYKHRDELRGKIKFIFQPAEEGVRGAKSIVDAGHLDDVDHVLALHIFPHNGSSAKLRLTSPHGRGSLATTKLDFDFRGKAAHAGIDPQNGSNALLAASTAIMNMHAIPRYGLEPTHINVGILKAGTGRNVVCDQVHMEAETRGGSTEANKYVEEYAVRVAESAAAMHGCSVDIEVKGAAPVMNNSEELVEMAKDLGVEVEILEATGNGSEDFAYFAEKVGSALYMQLPCECAAPNHNSNFDFDESVLATGVELICKMVLRLMEKE